MFWGLLIRGGANELPGWPRAHPPGRGAVAAPFGVGAPLCCPPGLRALVHHAAHTTPRALCGAQRVPRSCSPGPHVPSPASSPHGDRQSRRSAQDRQRRSLPFPSLDKWPY